MQGPDGFVYAGDLVFCPEEIAANCKQFSEAEKTEWLRLAVHGILHLSGQTHDGYGADEPMLKYQETIVEELKGEKMDIIKYSENAAEYIAAALSPADVLSVEELPDAKSCRVVVPDDQLSLAIGKEGQNARLAAKLTGYKIDIKPESEA